MWNASRLAEALETDRLLRDTHEDLFEQVRIYADQVEALDSDAHNAAQEVSRVVLALSYAETAQERLDILKCEARRLMLAVGEAKRRRRRRENLTMFMPVMLVILYSLLALILEGATPF